jgi:GTP pyrophosphokinase
MVSVSHGHSLGAGDAAADLDQLTRGLAEDRHPQIEAAIAWARELYAERTLDTGETVFRHGLGLAGILASINADADTRLAGLLFDVAGSLPPRSELLAQRYGAAVAEIVRGATQLTRLRLAATGRSGEEQAEVVRKMLLAMVQDLRVVLIRLASRLQTLRYFAKVPSETRREYARETLDLLAPLANRLGVWQLKWELEDLSFRFLEPETYTRIAKMLEEKRVERENFIRAAMQRLSGALQAHGIRCEVSGRPKHIYSIVQKMRRKSLPFDQVYDVRALRVLVHDENACYAALGVVHDLWRPIETEFDDYIARPKANAYRSLHTAVQVGDGRSLEVQVRTFAMHHDSELGIAAHWRYKEGAASDSYDEKIALLRRLLAWKDECPEGDWTESLKRAALDDTVYVFTPQGRVVALPRQATPLDFAYAVHTDLGHRCRGAKVNGNMVTLQYALQHGDRVEILAAKQGGPSRDWLNAQLGYVASARARAKIRQWFNAQDLTEAVAGGRQILERWLRSFARRDASLELLAEQLGFALPDELFAAVHRGEVTQRQVSALFVAAEPELEPDVTLTKPPRGGGDSAVVVGGVGNLMSQLAKCCRPVPPDPLQGFITRGRGVSVHRANCPNLAEMARASPDRLMAVHWSATGAKAFQVDIHIDAHDRKGLLRDITEIFTRDRLNVTAVNTQSRAARARMAFTVEVPNLTHLQATLADLRKVAGVIAALRR